MGRKWGWALVAAGALLVAVSVLADPLGIGEGTGLGYKQAIGAIVGAIALVAGLVLVYGDRRRAPSAEAES